MKLRHPLAVLTEVAGNSAAIMRKGITEEI